MLIQGHEVLVDAEFEPLLSKFRWRIQKSRHCMYAIAVGYFGGKQRPVLMHRLLTCFSGRTVDHINGNGLDNRLVNLRLCSVAENNRNARLRKDNTSGFRGVPPMSRYGTWYARVKTNGKNNHLGSFKTAEEAARAYDKFVRKAYGQFARTNFAD